jgi:hypothetical protein
LASQQLLRISRARTAASLSTIDLDHRAVWLSANVQKYAHFASPYRQAVEPD